jgi:DNA helicase HerA-like ATPase
LIRSKGVGVYFATQNPRDIPERVLAQLGNRVQHALRAFTPSEQRAVRAAADSFRPNPRLDTAAAITELAVGEALVSVLDERGQPTPVERAYIHPPRSRIGPADESERAQLMAGSLVAGVYERAVDRESAYEQLRRSVESKATSAAIPERVSGGRGGGRVRDTLVETMAKTAVRSAATAVAGALVRGLLGSLLGGTRRRR